MEVGNQLLQHSSARSYVYQTCVSRKYHHLFQGFWDLHSCYRMRLTQFHVQNYFDFCFTSQMIHDLVIFGAYNWVYGYAARVLLNRSSKILRYTFNICVDAPKAQIL